MMELANVDATLVIRHMLGELYRRLDIRKPYAPVVFLSRKQIKMGDEDCYLSFEQHQIATFGPNIRLIQCSDEGQAQRLSGRRHPECVTCRLNTRKIAAWRRQINPFNRTIRAALIGTDNQTHRCRVIGWRV